MRSSLHKHRLLSLQALRKPLARLVAAALILGSFPTGAIASSWSPTLLVNTEAFQSIDDGSGTSDIELRFGVTLNEKIYWDRTPGRFRLSDDVYVDGDLTASGTLSIESGISTDGNLTLNADQTAADTVLTFGSDTTNETLTFINVADRFEFSDDVRATGTLSASGKLTIDAAMSGASLYVAGHITGAHLKIFGSIDGGGLTDCDGDTQTVAWDAATGRFSCGDDDSAGIGFAESASYFVDDTGDTMTGALIINATNGLKTSGQVSVSGALIVSGRMSGGLLTVGADATVGGDLIVNGGNINFGTTTAIGVGGDAITINSNGTLTVDDALTVNSNVTIGSSAAGTDYTLTFQGETTDGILKFFEDESVFQFDSALQVRGPITASGHIAADGNLTLNVDQTNADTVLTFGSDTTNETLTFINAADRFEFSDDLRVTGGLYSSGGLIVEAGQTITMEGVSYTFPKSDGGASGMLLATNGAGQLSWTEGSSSGQVLTLQPEYPGAIYFSSGTALVGQLSASGTYSLGNDDNIFENYYHWQTTSTTMQRYWISTRVNLPDTFLRWDPVAPIKLRYRTGSGTIVGTGTGANFINVKLYDTSNEQVSLTGGTELSGTGSLQSATGSFKTANITGPETTGTFTAGSGITLLIQLAALDPTDANDRGFAEVSWIKFNWETNVR